MQIVFVDIVSYSKRKTQKQVAVIDVFTKLLESTITETAKNYIDYFPSNSINFRRDIIILPTGDGAVIGFPFDTIVDLHMYFSTQLIKSIYKQNLKANCSIFNDQGWCNCHDSFNLRIGLSEGKLILYKDINNSYNIAGNAINMAARVMAFADSNQIFLTKDAYKQFIDMAKKHNVEKMFREYTNVKIKHGLMISVYQYIDDSIKGLNSSMVKLVEPKVLLEETVVENKINDLSKTSSSIKVIPPKLLNFLPNVETIDSFLVSVLENYFTLIPNGEFMMGDEKTGQVKVSISKSFLIAKFPIKQSLYSYIMKNNPSYFKGDDLPIENITWFEAINFCNQLSTISGLNEVYISDGKVVAINYSKNGFRLPTEAEWEYACRGYTTGDTYDTLDDIAWYSKNSGKKTHQAGQKKANNFGLFDMLGNVWEWCNDWYEKDKLKAGQIDSHGPTNGFERVLRGGSWANDYTNIRSHYRSRVDPYTKADNKGFRIVLVQNS